MPIPLLDLATPQSVVNALNPALGYPGVSALLTNKTSVDYPLGYNDSSDPGYVFMAGAWPNKLNYVEPTDWRRTTLNTVNAEIDATLGNHWVARANFGYNSNVSKLVATGISTFAMAPPDSLVYNAASGWSVSPSWTAMSAAQQLQDGLNFAQQEIANPKIVYTTNVPVIDNRRQRFTEYYGHNETAQAEASGSYVLPWATIKPVVGIYADRVYAISNFFQNAGNAASPYFQTWDTNPLSPTHYMSYGTYFSPAWLTNHITDTLGFSADQAAYAILNNSFLNNTLFLTFGARYNLSQSQGTNFLGATPAAVFLQGYRTHYTTPQVGIGYKITPAVMLYGSYSTSYTPRARPTFPPSRSSTALRQRC